jgi:hypothetical protein
VKKITAGICLIFRGLFFEHNAEIVQKDHLWVGTNKNRVRIGSAPYQLRQFIRKIYGLEQSRYLPGIYIYINAAIGRV